MKDIVIKGNWRWFWLVFVPISFVLNITLVNIHFEYVSLPSMDREVTRPFNQASPDLVAVNAFTFRLRDRYYVMVRTTKEGVEMLEKLANER